MLTPRDYLLDFALREGISSIYSKVKNLNRVAIWAERGKIGMVREKGYGRVVENYKGLRLLRGKGDEEADVKFVKGGEKVELGIELEYPKFVIDFGLWSYHSRLERRFLLKQVEQSIAVIRDFLWDRNLVFARAPAEVRELAGRTNFFGEVVEGKWKGEAIVLDPNAEEELKRFEEGKVYIIGGIVERDRRMRTTELGYDLPRASIRYKGKASLVPDRINLILKIACENLLGKELEKAIEENMGRRERAALSTQQ